ncbi:rare lipoprotein A precursor [Halorhodospira halochloris]|uniref:Endolytic peptidoglycan transglycosylase RlpA n=1 Tax=Halorhodospira halochloris TaxID=1052 RepID=A0A110B491_HALHR|nr:septal ring lytic transglycosylase RlpA family protein [Halorhodospira halochloris]MCG5547334.1 septal ring lytic transglycosylase RlpA family protein [Halorhodospira halochloris]BAU56498.1 rare lipoprotein A precursor [Halorhodospira halochloris]
MTQGLFGNRVKLFIPISSFLVYQLLCGCSTTPEQAEDPAIEHEPSEEPDAHAPPGPDVDPSARVAGDGPSLHRSREELTSIPDAVPRKTNRSRYGNPETYEVFGQQYSVMDSAEGFTQRGYASWYGRQFHGQRTSSGTPYDMYAMTAAHREIPLPSWAEVTNLENGQTIVVKINDRGPFVDTDRRIIDLSYAAAVRLDIDDRGTAPVKIRVIETPPPQQEEGKLASVEQTEKSQTHHPTPAYNQIPVTSFDHFIAAADQLPPLESNAEAAYLQAGAFSSRDNAKRTQQKLRQFKHPVEIDEINREQGVIYRVILGPIKGADELENTRADLEKIGVDAIPVRSME